MKLALFLLPSAALAALPSQCTQQGTSYSCGDYPLITSGGRCIARSQVAGTPMLFKYFAKNCADAQKDGSLAKFSVSPISTTKFSMTDDLGNRIMVSKTNNLVYGRPWRYDLPLQGIHATITGLDLSLNLQNLLQFSSKIQAMNGTLGLENGQLAVGKCGSTLNCPEFTLANPLDLTVTDSKCTKTAVGVKCGGRMGIADETYCMRRLWFSRYWVDKRLVEYYMYLKGSCLINQSGLGKVANFTVSTLVNGISTISDDDGYKLFIGQDQSLYSIKSNETIPSFGTAANFKLTSSLFTGTEMLASNGLKLGYWFAGQVGLSKTAVNWHQVDLERINTNKH